MSTTIAISGKGGSGKTTIAAMITRLLTGHKLSTLAVDADPNACLGLMLGTEPAQTIAEIREKQAKAAGTDRLRSIEYAIHQAVTEGPGFDLLTMGRPEGPGCYCAVNNLLRGFLDRLTTAYDFAVIDNEAGMEHLSRRTTNNVDLLFIVAEATALGEATAKRIFELAKELPIAVKESAIIWNKTDEGRELNGIKSLGCIPYDESVVAASMQGRTIFDIDEDCPAFSAVQKIFANRLGNPKIRI